MRKLGFAIILTLIMAGCAGMFDAANRSTESDDDVGVVPRDPSAAVPTGVANDLPPAQEVPTEAEDISSLTPEQFQAPSNYEVVVPGQLGTTVQPSDPRLIQYRAVMADRRAALGTQRYDIAIQAFDTAQLAVPR